MPIFLLSGNAVACRGRIKSLPVPHAVPVPDPVSVPVPGIWKLAPGTGSETGKGTGTSGKGSTIEHVPHLASQSLDRERLLQEVVGVTGNKPFGCEQA